MQLLADVANNESPTRSEREAYFASLKRIYSRLPPPSRGGSSDQTALFVGVEREGRILAEAIDCLPAGHSIHPHTKRVPLGDGLEIGIAGIPPLSAYSHAVIIDGAIASGATLIAVISKLRSAAPSFEVRSAHAAWEGLRAIVRYCEGVGVRIQIVVGHATAGLNCHFYAIQENDPSSVVVGDLGDTISDLVERS
jgi:hypothetical protein